MCLMPMAIAVGIAIDFNNATRVRFALQDASDSAALTVARNASTIVDDAAAKTAANNYISASYDKGATFVVDSAHIDRATLTVTLAASANVPTFFAGLVHQMSLPISVTSVIKGQGFDYEIVMALDNSGSMSDSLGKGSTKIAELRKAARALLDAMMTSANAGHVKIGMVPFAASVKIGPTYANAAWMDTGGLADTAEENFVDKTTRRLGLFDPSSGMTNVSWSGCVESRPIKVAGSTVDYDANDAVPTTTKPNSLFEPWFAPDEPDGDNYGWDGSKTVDLRTGPFLNSYLNDEKGDCSSPADTNKYVADLIKQQRVCKYKGVTPDTSDGKGPNYMCTTTAVTPLTATRSTLDTAISAMQANGTTNILEGMAWAWRVLSPTAPFTEGAPYTTPNLNKVVILMSDGENNYPGANNMNRSDFFSYGYSAAGRIGTTSNTTTTLISKLNDRTKLACDNAKAAGIIIYTVALGASANISLMSYCATQSDYAYAPTNGSDLTPTFQAIAASINKLRIAQ